MEFKKSVQKWDFCCSQRAFLSWIFWLIACHPFTSFNGKIIEEERTALLQLRDSLNHPNGSALIDEWIGDDYCAWSGIFCASNPDGDIRVLDIFLTSRRQLGLGVWYPNASLLSHLQDLKSLYLPGNYFGSWVMPEALCRLGNLKLLDLSSNPLDGDIIPHFQTCSLSSLEELHLSSFYSKSFPALTALCGLKNLRSLDLSNNNINDENAPSCLLNDLSSLETLDLSGNRLRNSPRILTALCGLRNLKKLDLSNNSLNDSSIPPCLFDNSSSLESLDISLNYLKNSSKLFSGICKLQKLQTLNLNRNLIQGSIGPCLTKMASLVSLDLSFNHFQGNFPSYVFSNLTSLETLLISDNKFDGTLFFAAFANLSNLQDVDLSNNNFVVNTESPSWEPSFQLVSLNLRSCAINNYHGRVVPSFISSQKSIRVISLAYNALQGALTSSLLYNTTLTLLSLRGNSFSGEIPLASGLATSNLMMLDISDNRLYGQLPSNLQQLFPDLYYLNASFNIFKGVIPSSYGNTTKLEVLDLSSNFLQGKIPVSLRQNNTSLAQLVLSGNNFHEETVPSFSNMSNLAYLQLQNLGFSGSITGSLTNLPILKVLDISQNNLSGNIPDWFHIFPNLAIVIFARNQFKGTIPISLCKMQHLHVLDFSANVLSGVIPSCLSNITSWKKESELLLPSFMGASPSYANYRVKVPLTTKGNSLLYEGTPLSLMTGIDLSMNQLTGEIPSHLGELAALHSLNLSFNILGGHIPKSFSTMEKIESLDLSYNKLVGTIPPEIVQLHFISTFNLSFNNLTGSIPFENNFQTFDESSYRGNKGLCGPPLHINCSASKNHRPPQKQDKEEDDRKGIAESDFFFFSCIAVSYVLGFWGVILPLILSKNWRRKHDAIVDSCIYICCNKFSSLVTRNKDCC